MYLDGISHFSLIDYYHKNYGLMTEYAKLVLRIERPCMYRLASHDGLVRI